MIQIQINQSKIGKDTTLLYGQFIEHALDCIEGGVCDPSHETADQNGIREDVVKEVLKLQPPVIRFPGGTIMCQYHWQDAVGPKEERIYRKNLIWGGELDPSFGTAEFVSFCRQVGAEPMICVNMESGTPEEAGNWVEYCNGTGNSYYAKLRKKHGYEEPFHVKYWCIGNESFSKYDLGIHDDVKIYTRDAMEYIKRMKLTDPTIKTIIVGCDDEEWNKSVLDALQEVTDYFSIHHYSGTNAENPYEPFRGLTEFDKTLDQISELIDSYPEEVKKFNQWYRFPAREAKIQIAVDEWNIWDFKEDETYGLRPTYCFRDALWVSSMLNLFINKSGVGMANMAQLVNVLAPIRAEKDKVWLQTIAYPLIEYRNYMSGKVIEVNLSENPMIAMESMKEVDDKAEGREKNGLEALSVSAVVKDEGIYLAIVNRDLQVNHEITLVDQNGQKQKLQPVVRIEADFWNQVCGPDQNCVNILRENELIRETENQRSDNILCPASTISIFAVTA